MNILAWKNLLHDRVRLVVTLTEFGRTVAENGTTGTALLKAGETADVVIGPFQADAEAWCTVAGHKEAGMKLATLSFVTRITPVETLSGSGLIPAAGMRCQRPSKSTTMLPPGQEYGG